MAFKTLYKQLFLETLIPFYMIKVNYAKSSTKSKYKTSFNQKYKTAVALSRLVFTRCKTMLLFNERFCSCKTFYKNILCSHATLW